MENLVIKIEDGGLWIEERHTRFEDLIMPHQHLIHILPFILCHESSNFEDIVKLWDDSQLFPGLDFVGEFVDQKL